MKIGKIKSIQSGFAAIAAIFVVVILAALGSFMVAISNSEQLSSSDDYRGYMAYWSARSGLEWGFSMVKSAGTCPATSTTLSIGEYSFVATCTSSVYVDGGVSSTIFVVTSVASTGVGVGSIGYIERSVTASYEM